METQAGIQTLQQRKKGENNNNKNNNNNLLPDFSCDDELRFPLSLFLPLHRSSGYLVGHIYTSMSPMHHDAETQFHWGRDHTCPQLPLRRRSLYPTDVFILRVRGNDVVHLPSIC